MQGQPRLVRTPGGQMVIVASPQGAQNIRQQIGVASAAGGVKPIPSGQILRRTGAGGQVQHIVVSQATMDAIASSAKKIETTSGDTKPKEKAKKRYSCKLCDKSCTYSHNLKEHERNIHGAPGSGCYGPWPAPYYSTQQQQSPTQK